MMNPAKTPDFAALARSLRGATLALALSCAAALPACGQGVTLSVWPETLSVAPLTTVTLELRVAGGGSSFNGYDAIIEYDPARLTFLQASPVSLQEGPYMKTACANRFHVFSAAGDSLSISHVLLCARVSLAGPGTVYLLRFRTSATPSVTHVRLRSAQFYNDGLYINPTLTRDATILSGATLGVTDPPGTPSRWKLAAAPNPAHGRAEWWIDAPVAAEQRLEIFDLSGRCVRHVVRGFAPAGRRSVHWDGRDDRGGALPAGLYHARLHGGEHLETASLVWLP